MNRVLSEFYHEENEDQPALPWTDGRGFRSVNNETRSFNVQ